MPLLMGLCDRVYALETGQVIAEGTLEKMRANPRVVTSCLGTDETAISRSDKVVPQQPREPARELVGAGDAAAAHDRSADEDVPVLATAGRTAGGGPSTRRSTRRAR